MRQHDIVIPPYLAMEVSLAQSGQVQDWGHKYLQATEFYGKTRGERTIIFILDTSGRFDHPDLVVNSLNAHARNFTDSPTLDDKHGHGTHCAGIAAATDNAVGVIGIAPGARLVPVKVLNDTGSGNYDWVSKGIRYAADAIIPGYEGYARVISLSLGGSSPSAQMEAAIDYAIDKGCYVVAAAGNSGYNGGDTVGYPGKYEQVITVASIGRSEMPSRFSSGGPAVDVAAPGEGILSTHINGTYVYLSGTSMATPGVAGIVALMASYYGQEIKGQGQMEYFLEKYAKDIHSEGEDNQTGAGAPLISGYLGKIPGENPPPPPPPPGDDDPTDPTPPERGARNFMIDFVDLPPVRWSRPGESGLRTSFVPYMRLAVTSRLDADATYKFWVDTVTNFFTNRGYQLLPDSDWADAAYWAAYFLKLIVGKVSQLEIVEVHGADAKGNTLVIGPDDYKPKALDGLYLETFNITKNTPTMGNQIGITQTVEMFDAALALKEAIAFSKAGDGKVTFPADLVNFVAPIPRIIRGVEGANQIPAEWSDLSDEEINTLRARFGDIVDDERWQRVFYGLVYAGDAILEIIDNESAQ